MSKTLREQLAEATSLNGSLRTQVAREQADAENARQAQAAAEHEAAAAKQKLEAAQAEIETLRALVPAPPPPADPFAGGGSVVMWGPDGSPRKFTDAGEYGAAMHEGKWYNSPAEAAAAGK